MSLFALLQLARAFEQFLNITNVGIDQAFSRAGGGYRDMFLVFWILGRMAEAQT